MIELLRKEWKEAIELVGAVKLWIQLSIPPIESGGQFHVGVQEECVQELNRFEDVVRLVKRTAKRGGIWRGEAEGGKGLCGRARVCVGMREAATLIVHLKDWRKKSTPLRIPPPPSHSLKA